MYLDPPYPNNKVNYAHNMRDISSHEQLAERLTRTNCSWILSTYDTPEMHDLFSGRIFTKIQSSSGMNIAKGGNKRTLNKEVLITNFDPSNITPFVQKEAKSSKKSTLRVKKEASVLSFDNLE